MTRISPLVYENLTPKQRVVACVEALSRGDESERLRLVRSCPKLTYTQSDVRFSETIEKLMRLAMAVESDLKECVLRYLISFRINPETSIRFLQDFANIREAWKITLTSMSISEAAMASAGPPKSPVFELIDDLVPKPDKKTSEILSVEMLDCL